MYEAIRSYNETQFKALTEFASELVQQISLTGDEESAARLVMRQMQELGYDEVYIDEYGSVVGRVGRGDERILFDGHIDTVAVNDADLWHTKPFAGVIRDGKLYGRGSSDMKAAVATSVFAAAAAKKLGLLEGKTVYVSASVLEEDYDGVALLDICESIKPECVVICEPSSNRIMLGQKGRAVIRLDFNGVSAHGSAPEDGDNAIYKALAAINRIKAREEELTAAGGSLGTLALTRIASEAVSLNAIPAT